MDTITLLIGMADQLPGWLNAIAILISACAGVAAMTKTTVDDEALGKLGGIWNIVSRVVNTLALNVGQARNADDVLTPKDPA
jgi:hypothetical protein